MHITPPSTSIEFTIKVTQMDAEDLAADAAVVKNLIVIQTANISPSFKKLLDVLTLLSNDDS